MRDFEKAVTWPSRTSPATVPTPSSTPLPAKASSASPAVTYWSCDTRSNADFYNRLKDSGILRQKWKRGI